jgi:hypothetical protein
MLRIANPVLRALITSPVGRAIPPSLAVLEFTGRRSGRALKVVVNLHEVDGALVVFTPARWRHNFRGGAPVSVVRGGRRLHGTGTLVDDPVAVAAALHSMFASGKSPRTLGLEVPPGHDLTPDDVRAVGRTLIRLDFDAA